MKKSSVNTFTEGLVCDLDPINVPNNVLTDCLNGTIITYDDNEFSLQNDKGNYPLKDCKLNPGFIPVGIKEHGGILYIVSLNPLTGEEEIGSYPSPKLYDGGTVNGNIDISYIIDKTFEELNVSEVEYSEIKSRCKSWYYSNSNLQLNVGDKFWFEEDLDDKNFEKIEKYIIDENSVEHLILKDWINKYNEYVSPISGTIMLKNKIFEFANSNAETNTFTCWSGNSDKIDSLFSFTHKLYIDDEDTLKWIDFGHIKYQVNLKVNNSVICSQIFDGEDQISIVKQFGQYEIAIESKNFMKLEWYGNNKIISKYFVSIIKNINSNDQISAEIIPILSIADSKDIILSDFKKSLTNNVSDYVSTTWNIGDEYYRFYNHPIEGIYKTQYIELDIKGPVEASSDFILTCNICKYPTSSKIMSKSFAPGIGKAVLQINYNNIFVKEDVYTVEYSIILAGTVIKTITKMLITSELFNYNEFLTYKDYSLIPNDVWMSKYVNTIDWGSIHKTHHQFIKNLPNSEYAWINNKEDIYLKNELPAMFIYDPDYLAYINKFNDGLIEGNEYSFDFDLNVPKGLTGNLWTHTNSYECVDQLGKYTKISSKNFTINIPIGVCQKLNMIPISDAIWGPVESINLITPSEYGKLYIVGSTQPVLNSDDEYYIPGPTVTVSNNGSVLGSYTSSWMSMGDITSKIKPFFNNLSGINNVTEFRFGANGVSGLWAECSLNGIQLNGSKKFYLCQSDNGMFGGIPVNDYYAVNADKECKYKSGVWYNMLKNKFVDFSTPTLKINIKFKVSCEKLRSTSTFNNSYTWIDSDLWSNNFDIDSKFDDISSNANKHFNQYNLMKDLITAEPETYIKGIISNKRYFNQLCEHYRLDDKIIVSGKADNSLLMYWYQHHEGDGENSDYDQPLGAIYMNYV